MSITFLLLQIFSLQLIGIPPIQHYSSQDYGAHPHNYDILQLNDGRMAFANHNGLLLHNGYEWTFHRNTSEHQTISLMQLNNRLYMGGKNSFAYYDTGTGDYQHKKDLTNRLRSFVQHDFTIREIFQYEDGLLLSGEGIFIFYSDDDFKQIRTTGCEHNISHGELQIFYYYDNIFILCNGQQVYRLSNTEEGLQLGRYNLFNQDIGQIERVLNVNQFKLLLYSETGLYVFSVGEISSAGTHYENADRLSVLRVAYSGQHVISEIEGAGIQYVDLNTSTAVLLNSEVGVNAQYSNSLFRDESGQIWMSGPNGIYRFNTSSNFRRVAYDMGLRSDVNDLVTFAGTYIVAAEDGLYYAEENQLKKLQSGQRFHDLISSAAGLFALSDSGLWQVNRNIELRLLQQISAEKLIIPDGYNQQRLLAFGINGWIDLVQNSATQSYDVFESGGDFRAPMQAVVDFAPYFWVLNKNGELFQFRHSAELSLELSRLFLYINDNDNQINTIFVWDDSLRVSASKGYYIYQNGNFVADTHLNRLMNSKIITDFHQSLENHAAILYSEKGGKSTNVAKLYKNEDGNWRLDTTSYLQVQQEVKPPVYMTEDLLVWAGVYGGLINFEPLLESKPLTSFTLKTAVATVINSDTDTLLYSLSYFPENITVAGGIKNLRFTFYSNYFGEDAGVEFQTKLSGLQNEWSSWRSSHVKSYTNLGNGKYEFQVRARLASGTISEVYTLPITILPPWYSTNLAYFLYTIFGFMLIGLAYYYVSGTTRRREIVFEKEIDKRTEEIESQKETLKKQAEELQFINSQRTQFFNNISHEFRTPLTLIMGPLQRVIENTSLNEDDKQALEVAHRNASRLRSLTNQMLDITRMQKGQVMHDARLIDVCDVIMNTANRFVFKAKQEQKEFGYRLPDHKLMGEYDPEKLDMIISNMLNNAFKFSNKGDKIIITAGYKKDDKGKNNIILRIEDTGIGIPKDQQAFIFDYYYQVEMSEMTYSEGTGVGLSYVKDLVELHNGSITVDSRVDLYTTFDVTLPTDHEYKEPDFDQLLEEKMQHFVSDLPVLPQKKPAEIKTQPATGTILVVEDNLDLQMYLKILFRADYDVMVADNGRHALEQISEKKPSLIISDVMMPEMDGWSFLEILKLNEDYRTIPVIMLTALTESEERIKALRTGVDDYISKPFDKDELLIRVDNLLKNYQERLRHAEEDAMELSSEEEKPLSLYNKIITVIEEHMQNPEFSSVDLAKELAMSERSMYDKVKSTTGLTPIQLINQKRIEYSRKLLTQTDHLSITEIAFESGFASSTYFSRTFKKVVGITPVQYRSRYR